ncbi:MAG: sensor histidine kinase [Parvibaculaceae bacterium]
MAADLAAQCRDDPDLTLETHTQAHLKQAEQEIAWLRWFGMAVWALILLTLDRATDPVGAWAVYAGGFAYAVWAHWRIGRTASIDLSARLTTVGDPVLAALMCAMTGGIGSLFYPFFYFTLLATAFRFGVRAAVSVLGLNAALTILLYWLIPTDGLGLVDLSVSLLYLVFSALLGMMMARWAQANLDLAQSRERAFRAARDKARSLSQRLVRAQEDERRTVAGDLHDRLGHHLFVLHQGLSVLAASRDLDEDARTRLVELEQEAKNCSNDVRLMMNELRPTVLDDFGFCEAVRDYVARAGSDLPFRLRLHLDDKAEPEDPEARAMLFRIVQECLLNVRKHADATEVEISLTTSAGKGTTLAVRDNGKGVDPDMAQPGHLGLLTMRERAEALGGSLDISSRVGGGTIVSVRLPSGDGG